MQIYLDFLLARSGLMTYRPICAKYDSYYLRGSTNSRYDHSLAVNLADHVPRGLVALITIKGPAASIFCLTYFT